MDILIVRHAESEGNAAGRMQGRRDLPLSQLGRSQARALGAWLASLGARWDATYASPLSRAFQTAEIVTELAHAPPPLSEALIQEIAAGQLEGLTREEMAERFPTFLGRGIGDLGDFAEFGGESYDEVQSRVQRFAALLEARHRENGERVLVVAHGGFNFQLVKHLICAPVPRVCILKMGNCASTLVRMRERRARYIGEIVWHVPVELMGERSADGNAALFR